MDVMRLNSNHPPFSPLQLLMVFVRHKLTAAGTKFTKLPAFFFFLNSGLSISCHWRHCSVWSHVAIVPFFLLNHLVFLFTCCSCTWNLGLSAVAYDALIYLLIWRISDPEPPAGCFSHLLWHAMWAQSQTVSQVSTPDWFTSLASRFECPGCVNCFPSCLPSIVATLPHR